MFLLRILIFKGLTAQRLYKSFGIKGLMINLMVCKVTHRLEKGTCNMFLLSLVSRKIIVAFYVYEIMGFLGFGIAGMTCAVYGSDISLMKLDTLIISR
jgi:hypothetical protein